jgi:hypothetical protein
MSETPRDILMPAALTAENGAKGLLSGEFHETVEVGNPDYCGCGHCHYCDMNPEIQETEEVDVPVSWTTIKDIYAMCVRHVGETNDE